MAWTKGQCAAAGAGEHELVDTEARHLEPRHRPGIGPRPGFDFLSAAKGFVPGFAHEMLRELGLGVNVGTLPELPQAGYRQQAGDPN